jgi:primary-amine oxidase
MKTITKFIFGFPMLALACGSIASAQVPLTPLIPPDSAAKAAAEAAAEGARGVNSVSETVAFTSGSRWDLTVIAVDKYGLVIKGASFQKSPTSRFIYVLHDGRLAEIFVPYHSGSPRFGDISDPDFDFKPLTLNQAKFPPPRQIIGGGKICKEVRDYLAWMRDDRVRYGQEVVYFSVLEAGNYNYVMEWTFRDDGTILVRAGSTGPKLPLLDDNGRFIGFSKEGHIHNFTWRLDIDLNGADANSAYWTSHSENLTAPCPGFLGGICSTATDNKELISIEGSRVWNPEQFNTLEIVDARLKNGKGRPTGYELIPMRSGTARHSEPYTQADFWVTRYNPAQIVAQKLPSYILAGQSTINKDLVIWYTGSEHHETDSRAEDFNTVPVLWTGFELDPQNLFDGTPFYP